jgi:hypothetical protein
MASGNRQQFPDLPVGLTVGLRRVLGRAGRGVGSSRLANVVAVVSVAVAAASVKIALDTAHSADRTNEQSATAAIREHADGVAVFLSHHAAKVANYSDRAVYGVRVETQVIVPGHVPEADVIFGRWVLKRVIVVLGDLPPCDAWSLTRLYDPKRFSALPVAALFSDPDGHRWLEGGMVGVPLLIDAMPRNLGYGPEKYPSELGIEAALVSAGGPCPDR